MTAKTPTIRFSSRFPLSCAWAAFTRMPFPKRRLAIRDAAMIGLRVALGASPGWNTGLYRKRAAVVGSTRHGSGVTGGAAMGLGNARH